jgi:hypothetical protein
VEKFGEDEESFKRDIKKMAFNWNFKNFLAGTAVVIILVRIKVFVHPLIPIVSPKNAILNYVLKLLLKIFLINSTQTLFFVFLYCS